jgi:hypothetical protein
LCRRGPDDVAKGDVVAQCLDVTFGYVFEIIGGLLLEAESVERQDVACREAAGMSWARA